MKYFKIKKICEGKGVCYPLGTEKRIDKKYTRTRKKSRIAYGRNDPEVYIFFIKRGHENNDGAGKKTPFS